MTVTNTDKRKVVLLIWERLMISSALPEKGDLLTARVIHELRQDLSFSDEEIILAEMRKTNAANGWAWSQTKDPRKEFSPGIKASEIIVDALTKLVVKLDSEDNIKEEHIRLVDKLFTDDEKNALSEAVKVNDKKEVVEVVEDIEEEVKE